MEEEKCKECGANFKQTGIGYDCHCYQVQYDDGNMGSLEIGDVIEYYCPDCGKKIPDKQAHNVLDEWFK